MKFQVYQSFWGMGSLPHGGDEEWNIEEKLEKIAEVGFDGVEWLMEYEDQRKEMVTLCDRLGLKRSNIVFPWIPLDLIEAVPDMVLCGDLSHFLVGREFTGPPLSEANQAYMEQILERCGAFHGRVASREQVQVPFLFEHNKVWLDLYAGWWEYGFKKFKARAGEDDVLTFVVELGPPTYAIQGADGQELSDRWEEAIYLKDLVREIWDRC